MIASTFAFSILAGVLAQQPIAPVTRTPSCADGGCHVDETEYSFLHGPTAAGFCRACHDYDDETAHTFELKRSGADMCNFCHLGKTELDGLFTHKPVVEEQCVSCHNPHGSNRRFMLAGESNRDMCLACHEQILAGADSVHTPIAEGDCLQCHQPHASLHPSLLSAPREELCRSCHKAIYAPILEAQTAALLAEGPPTDQLRPVPFVHQPVEQDCYQCHEVHASAHASLLKEAPLTLCTSCHEPIKLALEAASVRHSAVTDDAACLNCHTPHSSDHEHLMRSDTTTVCLECHAQDIPKEDGTYVASLADLKAPGVTPHEPVANGDCRRCHNPHGESNAFLLNQPFPRDFYQAFSPESFALCFECHDETLATTERTDHATNFRNGELNLHYVHMIKQGDAGRSCRVCHTVHASAFPRLTRESTPFGGWNIPLRFTPTETGGSCAAGCHRSYRFDRVRPVNNQILPPE